MPRRSSLARWTRFRSPPERTPTFFCWSVPVKLNRATYARELSLRPPISIVSCPPEISWYTVLSAIQVVARLVDVAQLDRVADEQLALVGLSPAP